MDIRTSSLNGESSIVQPDPPRTGRHARPVSPSVGTLPDSHRDRGVEQLRAAHRALRDAHTRVRRAGADSDVVSTAFAIARDSLDEARQIVQEARKEVILVHYEYDELSRRLGSHSRYPVTASPVLLDTPDSDLCPDPAAARTAAQFMDALRTYRTWAGQPSYRAMASVIKNQCSQQFAASTLHAALTGSELPALPLVQAVITACGGNDAHQQIFTSAWRRITMSQQDGVS
ncbi:MAG TPA: hypothetical protein VMG38_11045 [Trebonia sp.]|nr:hypothetical protein [Trebonia sp.]